MEVAVLETMFETRREHCWNADSILAQLQKEFKRVLPDLDITAHETLRDRTAVYNSYLRKYKLCNWQGRGNFTRSGGPLELMRAGWEATQSIAPKANMTVLNFQALAAWYAKQSVLHSSHTHSHTAATRTPTQQPHTLLHSSHTHSHTAATHTHTQQPHALTHSSHTHSHTAATHTILHNSHTHSHTAATHTPTRQPHTLTHSSHTHSYTAATHTHTQQYESGVHCRYNSGHLGLLSKSNFVKGQTAKGRQMASVST